MFMYVSKFLHMYTYYTYTCTYVYIYTENYELVLCTPIVSAAWLQVVGVFPGARMNDGTEELCTV